MVENRTNVIMCLIEQRHGLVIPPARPLQIARDAVDFAHVPGRPGKLLCGLRRLGQLQRFLPDAQRMLDRGVAQRFVSLT